MHFSGVRTGVIAGVGVAVMVLAGCGASSTSGAPNDRHVDASSLPADSSANVAALDFAGYFQGADARRCKQIDTTLDGVVSNRLWETYSCTKIMTSADVKARCHYGAGSAGGGTKPYKTVTLSRHPLTQRLGPFTWGNSDICPGRQPHPVGGKYYVTLRKGPGGWYAIDYKMMSTN